MLEIVNMFVVFVITGLLYLVGVSADYRGDNFCKDQKIQEHIDMKQITGMWFAVETITHYQNTSTPSPYHEEPPVQMTDVCAVVTISDRPNERFSSIYNNVQAHNQPYSPGYTSYQTVNYSTTGISTNRQFKQKHRDHPSRQYFHEQHPHRNDLTITWDEFHTTTIYYAYYTSQLGLWYMYPPITGDGSPGPLYLVGNIQVLKAVGNHIVLTFCIRWPEEKLFSAILSRSHNLHRQDISGVHNLLRRLQLDFIKTRRMCLLNNSTKINVHHILLIMLSFIFRLL